MSQTKISFDQTKTETENRPQRISRIVSGQQHDKKNLVCSSPVLVEKPKPLTSCIHPNKTERIFKKCYVMRFLKEKAQSGTILPHDIRLALSPFSLALGDLDNNLFFIRQLLGRCSDFSEDQTRYYLRNNGKCSPYGCEKLRSLVTRHFNDFETDKCRCNLPAVYDEKGQTANPSPILFCNVLEEDLEELFSGIQPTDDDFKNYTLIKDFTRKYLSSFDNATVQVFLESKKQKFGLKQHMIKNIIGECIPASAHEPKLAEILIEMLEDAEIFHDPDDSIYATILINGHEETWPVKSKGFRRYLLSKFFKEYNKHPGSQAIRDALDVIEAKGQFEGKEYETHVRIAGTEDAIYIDLANDKWEAIKITSDGYKIISNPPVKFRRPRGMVPLPYPTDGSLDTLKSFLNLANENDWPLIGAWLVAAARPQGPYPILIFLGEQGSAKSTTAKLLKLCLDPSTSPLRTTPRENRDLMIGANNGWIVAFDNISGLPSWLSDALCRLSTGGGFSTRELYTDGEETIFNATRPIILNGIENVANRHDLADRAIIINLEAIPNAKRKTENEMLTSFNKTHPQILGAICTAVSVALKNMDQTRLSYLPRMADFALWATAAEPSLPWHRGEFIENYTKNIGEVVELALDADPVATAVRQMMEENQGTWEGSATELLEALELNVPEKVQKSRYWPKGPNILSGRIKRAANFLRSVGIEVDFNNREPGTGKRIIRLIKTGEKPSQPSQNMAEVAEPPENPVKIL